MDINSIPFSDPYADTPPMPSAEEEREFYEMVKSGAMRKKHGLDTSSGSDYFKARQDGLSDLQAQLYAYRHLRPKAF